MKRKRRRKCRNCGDLYVPDRRNKHHQRYCSRAECQKASHRRSQARWLARPENRDYHGHGSQVERVRAWRQAHPGYWRGKAGALQDVFPSQVADNVGVACGLSAGSAATGGVSSVPVNTPQIASAQVFAKITAGAPPEAEAAPLQDVCFAQDPVVVGLISILTGALQEDMAGAIAHLQSRGRAILRNGPGLAAKGV